MENEELIFIPFNVKTCLTCKKEKPIKSFSGKKYKNKIHYTNHCNKCIYEKRKDLDPNATKKYIEDQRFKECFTIEGRALLLRNRCRQRAKLYNREFKLSKSYIIELLRIGKCKKTGIDLIIDDSKYNPYAPSVDRIDNDKGYTDDNIQITCMIYNFCKNKFTETQVEEFFNKLK